MLFFGFRVHRDGIQPRSHGLEPNSKTNYLNKNGLQPNSDGLQPNSKRNQDQWMRTTMCEIGPLIAMAAVNSTLFFVGLDRVGMLVP